MRRAAAIFHFLAQKKDDERERALDRRATHSRATDRARRATDQTNAREETFLCHTFDASDMSRAGLTPSARKAMEDALDGGASVAVARAPAKQPAPPTRRHRRGRLGGPLGFLGFLRPKFRYGLVGFVAGCAFSAWVAAAEVDRRVEDAKDTMKREREARRQKKLETKQANKIIGVPIIEELPDEYEDGDPTRSASDAGEYKMVLVVREDLPMGAGKVAAQCAHGAVGAVNIASKTSRMELGKWELDGQKKVTLGVRSLARFEDLVREAKAARLPTFVVEDAGRTEVEAGTKTMVAIGPASTEAIDKITGSLRLY